jgi:hypothetical protein
MRINLMIMLGIVALAAVWRLVPHPDNMAPVAAMALFAGARLSHPLARYALPVAAMVISDLLIGFHSTMGFVYVGMLFAVLVGSFLRDRGVAAYAGASVGNSLVFFLITNFGVWMMSGMYAPNAGGLVASYAAGLPFLWKTLAGDLFFTMCFFTLFSLVDHARARRLSHA